MLDPVTTSKSKILRMKERRAYRDGIKRKGDKIRMVSVVSSEMEVVSEELGVPGVITPPLYRCTLFYLLHTCVRYHRPSAPR